MVPLWILFKISHCVGEGEAGVGGSLKSAGGVLRGGDGWLVPQAGVAGEQNSGSLIQSLLASAQQPKKL